MPIRRVASPKRPRNSLPGQALRDAVVGSDIKRIIKIDEAEASHRPIDGEGCNGQRNANSPGSAARVGLRAGDRHVPNDTIQASAEMSPPGNFRLAGER